MFKKFIKLEWKQFLRSAAFQQKLIVKIFLGFGLLYMLAGFIGAGLGVFFGLKEAFPDTDPFVMANNFFIFYFLVDLLFRFFLQQLPVLNIKPIMILPIKSRTAINFLIGKGMVSAFNILPIFFYIPYCITLLFNGYDVVGVLVWLMGMLCINSSINFMNFLSNKNNVFFGIVATLFVSVVGLWYFNIFDVSPYVGSFLYGMYATPYFVAVPVLLLVILYYLTFKFLERNFYLDGVITKKVKEVTSSELAFLNRFGGVAPFLKNDLKLIWRNKRPRQVIVASVMFLFYGLIFFTQAIYDDMLWFRPFIAVFITGGFLMTFGQLVPSWDSEYFKLMMSQNIPYKTYLESKWMLMVVATCISAVLSIPYIYFGADILLFILAGACFNIGTNSFLVLWGGIFNKTPVKLNDKAKGFGNTQAFNVNQLLISLPKMIMPIILFFVPYAITKNIYFGVASLAITGLLGVLFRNKILKGIEKLYQKEKYKTIAAYSEKN